MASTPLQKPSLEINLPPRRHLRGKNVEKSELATEKKVSISLDFKKILSEMTEGAVHQGFIPTSNHLPIASWITSLQKSRQEENPLVDSGWSNWPHNLGSILRTADATNVSGVIIPKHRQSEYPVVAVTATGALSMYWLRELLTSAKP